MSRDVLRLLAAVSALAPVCSTAFSTCPEPHPTTWLRHEVAYWLQNTCGGGFNVYAYASDDPEGTNSGGARIYCDAPDEVTCFQPGTVGDGVVSVGTYWTSAGMLGCPAGPPGPQRLVLAASGFNGTFAGSAILASIHAYPEAGYIVDLAHPYGAGTPVDLSCTETVRPVSYHYGTVTLRFTLPPLRTDCDQGSLGQAIGDPAICPDAFQPTLTPGPVYLLRLPGPCTGPIDLRRGAWTPTGVTPGADGRATIYAGPSSPDCLLAGSTVRVDGAETPVVVGYVRLDTDCADLDRDGDGYTQCQADCNDFDPTLHPGAVELCDGIDNDCAGGIDDDGLGMDSDGDGVHNACDNCRVDANPDQVDPDGDGQGTICDLDDGLVIVSPPDPATIAWQAEVGYDSFNLYRGDLELLRTQGLYTQDPSATPLAGRFCGVAASAVADPPPPPGKAIFYLVSGNAGGVEHDLGTASNGTPRPNANPCP